MGLLLAGVILAIMILPTMVAISRDVLVVVPSEQVEGPMALGATRWQVLRKVVVPGARTGILGAFTLATGRALGETVAVAMVIGNAPYIAHSLKSPAATLPSLIVNNFGESTGTELERPVRRRPGAPGHRHPGQLGRPLAGVVDRRCRGRVGGRQVTTVLDDSRPTRRSNGGGRSRPRRRSSLRPSEAGIGGGARHLLAVPGHRRGPAGRRRRPTWSPKGLPAWNVDFFTQSTTPEGIPGGGVWNAIVGTVGHHGDRHGGRRAGGAPVRPVPGRVRRPDRRQPRGSPPTS